MLVTLLALTAFAQDPSVPAEGVRQPTEGREPGPDAPSDLPPTPDEPAPQPPVAAPPIITGLADLHLHQWAEFSHGSRWYYGSAQGVHPIANQECGTIRGRNGRTPARIRHGQVIGRTRLGRYFSKKGFADERSDDVRPRHPPMGVSTYREFPHWLGWPTSDSLAHNQGWEGWLRLAHDGPPALHYVARNDRSGDDVDVVLDDFYADYVSNVRAAHADGVAGLNLAVVSLVASNTSCRGQLKAREYRRNPSLCNDMDAIQREYEAAVAWEGRNGDWARIVTSSAQAEETIAEGKLAVVLSIETADLFGPSLEAANGAFAGGYMPRNLEGDRRSLEAIVRSRLGQYLDAFPKVSTLQLAHQIDNPFSGAAYITNTFLFGQINRERNGGCSNRVIRDWKYNDDNADSLEYVYCWQDGLESPGSSTAVAIKRLLQGAPPAPFATPGWYRGDSVKERRDQRQIAREQLRVAQTEGEQAVQDFAFSGSNQYQNRYGLSQHGKWLVDEMIERDMPIDVSHMSRKALIELDTYLDEKPGQKGQENGFGQYPLYMSHSYPEAWDSVPRELNVGDDVLDLLAERGSLVGFRPGDDEIRLDPERKGELVSPRFFELLEAADCMGTSVGSGLFASHYANWADDGLTLTFGTDLTGFINQPGPTSQLRPPLYGTNPCSTVVPTTGSEVGQRGLAHVGLLPQMYAEMLLTAAPDDAAEAAVLSTADGAASYIDVWRRAEGKQPLPQSVQPVADARSWQDLLYDGTDLRRLTVGDGAQLPVFRALEAVMPYGRDIEGPLGQAPINLGFLLGVHSYSAYVDLDHFPVSRCKWGTAIIGKARDVGDDSCRAIREAKKTWRKNLGPAQRRWSKQEDYHRALHRWSREYPQNDLRGSIPAATQLARVPETVDGVPGHAVDFPTFAPVRDWVLADDARKACLEEESFLWAPTPGIPAATTAAGWFVHAQERLRGNRTVGQDNGMTCYCELLGDLDDGVLLDTDRVAAESCGIWLAHDRTKVISLPLPEVDDPMVDPNAPPEDDEPELAPPPQLQLIRQQKAF